MIQAEFDAYKREEYLRLLMVLPNQACQNVDFLKDQDVIRTVLKILQESMRLLFMVRAYQVNGHMKAKLDPLKTAMIKQS
ncbi:2-oxoglutarate dehydrogenase, mitochondrial [Trifolium repens]|nr:2-oxoglutarate dehydrogenase, mitochondrial [Trifolium repens]